MNASLYGAKLMRDLGAFDTAQVMDASEVDAPDLPVKNGGVLAVSQSGETKDVLRCVQKAMGHDVTALSVVNSVGSIIARTTKLGVYLNAGRENAVASTKAFTTQVTVRISASRGAFTSSIRLMSISRWCGWSHFGF